MPEFDPYDLSDRQLNSYRRVDTPSIFDTAVAVVNPDGTNISAGGGGGTVNQGTPNTPANAWPVYLAATSVSSFQQIIGTVETALTSTPARSVEIRSIPTNTSPIYIGTVGVTSSTGYLLSPGDTASLDITNSNLVHAVSTLAAQTITVLVTA